MAAGPAKVLNIGLQGMELTVEQGDVAVVQVGSEEWARGLAGERIQARKARNFKRSDEIRDELKANGWEVRDTKDGSEVVRVG